MRLPSRPAPRKKFGFPTVRATTVHNPAPPPQFVDVSHLLHRTRQKNIPNHGNEGHDHDRAPRVDVLHDVTSRERMVEGCETQHVHAKSVTGPPATNPTPPVISAIPSHRSGLTASCRANFATSASKTYPSDVAGNT